MGIFSKRMNKAGAVSGMKVGFTFTAAYIIFSNLSTKTLTYQSTGYGVYPQKESALLEWY